MTAILYHLHRALKPDGRQVCCIPFMRERHYAEDLGPLTAGEAQGLCARCLLKMGLATGEYLQAPSDGLKEQVKAAMSRLERDLILRALQQTQNNVTHAARLLKISRKGLQLKMKELNLRERAED